MAEVDVANTTVASWPILSNLTPSRGSDVLTDVPFQQRIIEAVILSLIGSIAIIGNTSLWIVICRDRILCTTSNVLILGLSMADLLISAINMPVTVFTIIHGRWTLSHLSCVIFGFITMCTFIASVMFLAMISINRFILICYPTKMKTVYTPRNTGFMIAGTWTLSVALAVPPLVGWGIYDYLPGQSFCFCNWKTSFSYTIFMVIVCFGGPCSVMTFCYIGILRKVRASGKRIQNSTASRRLSTASIAAKPTRKKKGSESSTTDIISSNITSAVSCEDVQAYQSPAQKAAKERKKQEDLRLTLTLLVIISVFIISWLPFCITMFLSVFSPYPVPRIPDILTLFLGCFNSLCNPIIYGVMNKRFWKGYKRIYCCLCNRSMLYFSESDQTPVQSVSYSR